MSLAAVRDLRDVRVVAGPDELAAFETDVLAGFVLARAAAGLADATIRSDVLHLEQLRAWFGRPLWDMQPADADAYFGTVLRDAAKGTRLARSQALKTYFLFLPINCTSSGSSTGRTTRSAERVRRGRGRTACTDGGAGICPGVGGGAGGAGGAVAVLRREQRWRGTHEVAAMVGWLRAARNPQRERRQPGSAPAGSVNLKTGKPSLRAGYAPATINHALTVVHGFYSFHGRFRDGPVVNPVPVSAQRRQVLAHRSPLEPVPVVRRARLRQRVPQQAPRSIPDALWDELLAAMGSDRDRALLEFYVSSGARASELLGVTLEDVDWGGQLIYVVSKGTRIRQPVPASPDAFRHLSRYLAAGGLPAEGEPVWRTQRGEPRPMTYWAIRRVLQRANKRLGTNWTLHDARHTAATRMAGDERLTLAEVQTILRHAHLDTTGTSCRSITPGPGRSVPTRPAMTPTTSRRSSVAEPAVTQLPADPGIVPTRFAGLQAAQALLPVLCPGPHGHLASASPEEIEAVMRRVWPGGRDAENRRARGARILLQHLDGFPGGSWQRRWEASGLNEARQPVNVLIPAYQGRKEICTGAACLFGLRVIRPSLLALRSTRLHGYGERFLAAQHDPLLEDFWKRVQDHPVHPVHHTAALFDVTVALTTQGITLDGLTPEAFLHYVWQSRDQGLNMKARGRQNRGQFAGQLAWPVLHEMGLFPPGTPPTVRAAVLTGRRTLEELVDRYEIRHQGVRQLILDYLARRRSELDYSSLDQHARSLAGLFWAKIEALAPGHPDLSGSSTAQLCRSR